MTGKALSIEPTIDLDFRKLSVEDFLDKYEPRSADAGRLSACSSAARAVVAAE